MKRWKSILFSLVIGTLLLNSKMPVYAHPEAREHNAELEQVLFEKGYSKHSSDKIKNSIKALEYASYLTIDQFGGNGTNQFEKLKKMKVNGLPRKFSTIDYNTVIEHPEKKITANTHRMYTHQGWDRKYSSKGKDVDKFWSNRRNVLLGTVNSVFGFHTITALGYGEKCNSLAGIIYYVHILGDYKEADKYTKISLLPDLAGRNNANDIDKDYDIITSLKGYIEILFVDQKDSHEYKDLMKQLDNIAKKAGKIRNSFGGVNTDEEFDEYHQYADDTLNVLMKYMPTLFKNEDFFTEVFYPERTK